MPVVSLAVETKYHLSNNIYNAETAQDVALKFAEEWDLAPDDLIRQIVCSSFPRDHEFECEVERLVEATIPDRFAQDYIWTEAKWQSFN